MNDATSSARDAALLLVNVGRAEEALRRLPGAFDATDPLWWYVRAAALLQLDRYADAIEAAKEGLAIDPDNVFLLDVLAAGRMQSSNLSGAEEAILNALRIDSDNPDLLTRYAQIVAHAGQIEKAEKLVARALAIDPESDYALQLDALLASASGDRRVALARSRELLRHAPENPLAHRLIGAAHADGGRVIDADDALRTAARLDPTHPHVVEAAREVRVYRHWLLWPLRPAFRIGMVPLWIGAVIAMLTLRAMKLETALLWFSIAWIVFCVYSWVAPPVVRRLTRRRW